MRDNKHASNKNQCQPQIKKNRPDKIGAVNLVSFCNSLLPGKQRKNSSLVRTFQGAAGETE
jgi:hypothetical protein